MRKLFHNQKVRAIWKALRPWATALVLLAILRYTGAISGISFLTQSALFETGVMDIDPKENSAVATSFDYDFVLKDLDGNKVDVSQFKNKVVFLNLWATWCGPCRVEMPSIQKLYESMDKEKVVFIMLALDNEENQHKIPKYIQDKQFTFPVFVPHEYLPKQLQVPSIPTTFVIGRDGKVKSKKIGTANYDTDKFRQFMEELTK
jgi:thiol-disulfide isomerase/thioredoxin